MKRLFYDIETSLGIFSGFSLGWNKTIGHKDLILEPRIICICYKFEGEKTKSIEWDYGDDKQLIIDFIKVLDEADEIVAHNGDGFDLPWIRGRAIKHRIDMRYDYPAIDTLKLAKRRAGKGFKFQSNRLDYVAQYLGVGKKIPTNIELWQRITYPSLIPDLFPMTSDYKKAMFDMVKYCKMDVQVLDDVYQVLAPYTPHKHHAAVLMGGNKWDCPHCVSGNIEGRGKRITKVGTISRQMKCLDCSKWYTISNKVWQDWNQFKIDFKNGKL